MYLRELRLHGFKSFADPTRLELRRGVTAIVGPNGCGKSNIADAIRWVLGEQSAKSLRAGGMQDVIFQGASNRKPVNLCEVTLVFDECEEKLGTAFNQVEITRRVVRDGGSDYYINGKTCRLKDIQRLFLDTGVGQVSYSFMLQGQIDQVLSSNPSERRAIFEEAAGISRYKAQRREALNKLGHTEANLARVKDVMEEVSRQIGSLKRQASKALRYKRIRRRLTRLDQAWAAWRWTGMNAEMVEMERKASVLRQQVEKLEKELNDAESGLAGKRARRNDVNQQLQEQQQKVFALRSEKENAQNRAELAMARKEDIEKRVGDINHELEELKQQQKLLSERLAGETKVKQEQLDLFGNSDEVFQQKSAELGELQQQLSAAEVEFSRARQTLMVKESALTRLRSNCTTLEVDLKTYQVRHSNLKEEIHQLGEEAGVLAQDVENLEKTRTKRLEDREKQDGRIAELKKQGEGLLGEFRSLQKRIQENERTIAGVQGRIGVLEGLQAKFEGFSEGARAILQGDLEGIVSADAYTLFLKKIQVSPQWTHAIEALLGTAGDGVYFHDIRRIDAVAEKLRDDKMGRASLLFSPPKGKKPTATDNRLPAFIQKASSVATSKDPAIAAYLEQFLSGCYLCESLSSFIEFWQENSNFEFEWMVTPDMDLINSRGMVISGTAKGKSDGSFLDRENQIKTLAQELEKLKADQEKNRLQVDQIQGRMDANEKRLEDQHQRVDEVREELSTLTAQLQNATKNREQNGKLLQTKGNELEQLESNRDESSERLKKARHELDTTEMDIEQQKKAITNAEEKVQAVREQRENLRESFNEIRLEIAEKRQRLELLDRGLEEIKTKSSEVAQLTEKRRNEVQMLSEQRKQLDEDSATQTEKIGQVDENIRGIMVALEKNREALKTVEKEIETVENGFAHKRETHDQLSKTLNQSDVQVARNQSQLQFIVDELMREYEIEPSAIDWKHELWQAGESLPERIKVDIEEESPDDFEEEEDLPDPTEEQRAQLDSTDWAAIADEVKNLRSRIQSMGPVNLMAIEEYKELKQRHDFLTNQSEDLWNAKEQLIQAIDEINATSYELFSNTFAQIRKNFEYTFTTLFGGGKSDLNLVDAEDILESGIEIIAQPPGTRLKTLALLSGGQKTMTAVALLFAIYMVKPSPFCVLDEIDAPLDDANVGRFTKMLENFLEYSQFLIITHNKRTISVADTIYGTTMQEKGVSKMISMRFNAATGKAESLELNPNNDPGI